MCLYFEALNMRLSIYESISMYNSVGVCVVLCILVRMGMSMNTLSFNASDFACTYLCL